MVFFCDGERFRYARPAGLVDARERRDLLPQQLRGRRAAPPRASCASTVLADHGRWTALGEDDYRAAKARCADAALARAALFVPDARPCTVFQDVFTPRTIERLHRPPRTARSTAPRTKRLDGSTGVANLHLCGTDQGLVGVVGALLCGHHDGQPPRARGATV